MSRFFIFAATGLQILTVCVITLAGAIIITEVNMAKLFGMDGARGRRTRFVFLASELF